MEQVASKLAEFDLEAALVRLWVLAGDHQRLNEWEHAYYQNDGDDSARNDGLVRDLQNRIQGGVALSLDEMNCNALALVLAIDAVLANNRRRNRLLRRHQIDGKQYWLVRQLVDWRARTALRGQRGNLLGWFSHHTIIPAQIADEKIDVKLYQCDGETVEFFLQLLQSPAASIKIWIGHFADGADVKWDKPHPIRESCRTTQVADGEKRVASLRSQLASASQEGAHFVVFPEFSLDLAQRKAAKLWLKNNKSSQLRYVVPGSFHEPIAGSTPAKYFNTAPLLDATGRAVFTHQKLRLFGKGKVAENVSVGKTVHVLVTPVGCLTVLICKDFMDIDASVDNLLQHVLVDWVLVPSFGNDKTIDGHKARARELAIKVSGTNSAVANSLNTAMEPNGSMLPGFAHRSGQDQSTPVPETGCIVEYLLPNAPETAVQPEKAQKNRPH
jgi:predicted amidohydrolase